MDISKKLLEKWGRYCIISTKVIAYKKYYGDESLT
jgi:hypothetical protein